MNRKAYIVLDMDETVIFLSIKWEEVYMCPGDQLPDPSTKDEQLESLQLVMRLLGRSILLPHPQVISEGDLMERRGEDQNGDSYSYPSRNWRKIQNRYIISSIFN